MQFILLSRFSHDIWGVGYPRGPVFSTPFPSLLGTRLLFVGWGQDQAFILWDGTGPGHGTDFMGWDRKSCPGPVASVSGSTRELVELTPCKASTQKSTNQQKYTLNIGS